MNKRIHVTIINIFFLVLAATPACAQQKWQSRYINVNANGSLAYIPDEKGNIIPDFSQVGYYHTNKTIPVMPVVKTVSQPGDDDQRLIQTAIDEVAKLPLDKNGFRGAILLKKGIYKIAGTIKINTSGIILRGEGEETKLVATGKGQRNLISVSGTGNSKEIGGTRKKIIDPYVPVGAKSFTVSNTDGLQQGDRIMLYRPGTANWINDLKMDQINQKDSTLRQWSPAEYNTSFERVITRIDNKTIYIDNPVVMAIEEKYGGGEIYKYSFDGRIMQVGVEDILCESEYAGNEDEDHGWVAVFFNRVENGWIKNTVSRYFGYSCVNLGDESKNITVMDSKCLDAKSKITGGRRYSFNNDGQQNLFVNCFASEGRHDFVTGAKVRGPNVFFNCRAEKTHADIGPHHRWAMGTLYDNIITTGEINIQDRGDWGTGHGWAGVNQVLWNCTAAKAAVQNPWVTGKNYVIGLKGAKVNGRLNGRTAGEWEGMNREGLEPSSLYLAQLKEAEKEKATGANK